MVDTGDLPRQQQAAQIKAWMDRARQISAEDWTAMLMFLKYGRAYIRTLEGVILQAAEARASESPTPLPVYSRHPPPLPPVSTTYSAHKKTGLTMEQLDEAEEALRKLREISNLMNIEEVFDDEPK